jgi:hypothetical protein
MIGAIAGSATSSAVEYKTEGNISAGRLAGATVGGAVTGGIEGALIGLSGEYGGQKAAEEAAKAKEEKRLKDARSKMIASADTGTVSDSGQSLGDVVVTGAKEAPGITDTSIITPTGPISDKEVMGAMKPAPISGVLKEVKVTAPRETPDITETSIVTPDTLPEVTVKGEKEKEPIAEAPVEEEPPVEEKGKPYNPNLFVYGGTRPSTLSQTLGTSVENVPTAGTTTGTSVGLGGRGEIESKESGKKRKTVWNEESLRLKDALGL